MYGDEGGTGGGSRAGFVGRRGLMAFILDVIAASPPLLAPPDLIAVTANGGGKASLSSASSSVSPQQREHGRVDVAAAGAATQPAVDLEQALEGVLAKMAGVVLAEVSQKGRRDGSARWLSPGLDVDYCPFAWC